MIEIVLIPSALQRSSFGPDFQAIAQTQALVRDAPHFLFTFNQDLLGAAFDKITDLSLKADIDFITQINKTVFLMNLLKMFWQLDSTR